jgi:hypothetical protein
MEDMVIMDHLLTVSQPVLLVW